MDGECAVLVLARDPESLATATVRLLLSEDTRASFGRAAQDRWRSHFRIDTMMQQVEAYFMLLTGKGVAA
ncbi:MAG: hypothetical protein NTW07_03610 [candidate division Zixibacteria bacterium]|nr:hypothetical protein [candidate division Zixibacteria bacterium]